MYRCVALLLSSITLQARAQEAFRDSLDVLAGRIAERMQANGHHTVALLSITDETGASTAFGEHVGSELMHRLLAGGRGLVFVERAMLGRLLHEQRLTASGITRDNGHVQLGELKEAGVLLTGSVLSTGRRTVRLDIRLINTSKGVVEGFWRTELAVPDDFHRAERARTLNRQRDAQQAMREAGRAARAAARANRHPWLALGPVATDHFGQWRPGLGIDMRKDARVSLGFRAQWNPLGSYTPQHVEFGHFALDNTSFMFEDPFSSALSGQGGEIYLVPAGDASFGAGLLMRAMDQRVNSATWSQVRSTITQAQRFSLMLPLRMKLGGEHQRVRPFIDMGYGLDLVTANTRHEGVSLRLERTSFNSYTATPDNIGWQGASFPGVREGFRAWNMLLGGGVEIGRLAITAEWRHAFHAGSLGLDHGRKVSGDPVTIAMLNGPALEDGQVLGEIEARGAVRIGRTDTHGIMGHKTSMERFLDRSHFQVGIALRF